MLHDIVINWRRVLNAPLLLNRWYIGSLKAMLLACILTGAAGFLYAYTAGMPAHQLRRPMKDSLFLTLRFILSYTLMLISMTLNAYLIGSIVVGAFLGFWLLGMHWMAWERRFGRQQGLHHGSLHLPAVMTNTGPSGSSSVGMIKGGQSVPSSSTSASPHGIIGQDYYSTRSGPYQGTVSSQCH